MKPETAKQLKVILEKRQEQKQASVQRVNEQQQTEAKNLADFLAKKNGTIKAAFQEIVDMYKARGLPARIAEQDEQLDDRRGNVSASVSLDFSDTPLSQAMHPEFRLIFEKHRRSCLIYTSTGSEAGPRGNVHLDDITADWIQDTFLKYASGTLSALR